MRNKKYIGIYTFGRVSGGKLHTRNNHMNDSSDMIEIPNGMPAIISQEIWNKVQTRMLTDKHATAKFKAKIPYYLTGKVFCAKCGSRMTGGTFISTKGTKYSYYRCCNNNKTMNGCKGIRIKKEWLETATLNYINIQLLNPKLIPLLTTEVQKRINIISSGDNREKKLLEQQRNEITGKINNLLDLAEDGQTGDIIRERILANKTRLNNIDMQINKFKSSDNFVPTKKQIINLVRSFIEKGKKVSQLREIIDTFLESIIVSKKNFIIKG